jgi:lysozyme
MNFRLSPSGFDAIRAFEGFAPHSIPAPKGRFVIGHGHVEDQARAAPIEPGEAEELLRADLAPVVDAVAAAIYAPVTQVQFDALVSFAFSIGLEAFRGSPVLVSLNAGHPLVAAQAISAWRYSATRGAPAEIDALVRRRAAEQAMFLALDPPVAAASALVRPVTPSAEPPAGLEPSEATARLQRILASRPETAVALSPPPHPHNERPEAETPLARALGVARNGAGADAIALTALAAFGLTLLLVGAVAFAAGGPFAGLSLILFGGPGALASLISLYYLSRLGA